MGSSLKTSLLIGPVNIRFTTKWPGTFLQWDFNTPFFYFLFFFLYQSLSVSYDPSPVSSLWDGTVVSLTQQTTTTHFFRISHIDRKRVYIWERCFYFGLTPHPTVFGPSTRKRDYGQDFSICSGLPGSSVFCFSACGNLLDFRFLYSD